MRRSTSVLLVNPSPSRAKIITHTYVEIKCNEKKVCTATPLNSAICYLEFQDQLIYRPISDWTIFRSDASGPPYCQPSRVYSFGALSEGGLCEGALLYGSPWLVGSLISARSPRAMRASRATNPCPSGLVALDLAESRRSYSRRSRCWQNDIDTARCCHRTIHAASGRSWE